MAATVSFVPNDPLASGGPPTRSVSAGNYPPGDIAKFDVLPAAKPGKYPPLTPEFDYWQTKLALIGGLRMWKTMTGSFLPRWWGDQRALPVLTDAGDDLNAFYDRSSLQFFSHGYGGVTVHSAESVDVVVHEQGHAILDAIRSDFFDVPFIEVGALHEAFGDCTAILAALEDQATRAGGHQGLARPLEEPVRREPGRAAGRRHPTRIRRRERRVGRTAPRAQHVPLGGSDGPAVVGTRRRAGGRGAQLRARLRRCLLRHDPQHLRTQVRKVSSTCARHPGPRASSSSQASRACRRRPTRSAGSGSA